MSQPATVIKTCETVDLSDRRHVAMLRDSLTWSINRQMANSNDAQDEYVRGQPKAAFVGCLVFIDNAIMKLLRRSAACGQTAMEGG